MAPSTTPRKTTHFTRSYSSRATPEPNEAVVIDQPSTLNTNTTPSQAAMSFPPANNTAATPSTVISTASFLATLTTHYQYRSDPITPHRFFQLCKDYNGGKLDEKDFYVAVYRLLFTTNALHIMPRFRAFLPVGWRDAELDWLDRAIEEDVRSGTIESRDLFGGLAGLMDKVGVGDVGFVAQEAEETAVDAGRQDQQAKRRTPEGNVSVDITPTEPTRKKKSPANGFRASTVPPPLALMQSLTSRYEASLKSSPPKLQAQSEKSQAALDAKIPSGKNKWPPSSKRLSPNDSPKAKPEPFTHSRGSIANLPQASAVPHLGPIYPSTRAILSRPSKPYIHSLCGQHFGHPQEVQRHHNGQSGRPGCWEKSGKPAGDEGKWDAHASCKVRLTDLEYVKVQEGYAVVSWGGLDIEGVTEGEEKDSVCEARNGQGLAMKNQVKREVNEMLDVDDEEGEQGENTEEAVPGEDDEDYTGGSVRTPKRQKLVTAEDAKISASEEGAAARAVVFGLRARK
ncbi:hypothetical protein Q7P37_005722 [Cladosporium fusiforme]